MIFQTKASILVTLLSLEGGQDAHLNTVLDEAIITGVGGQNVKPADDASNDRTQLKHQK